ncbi:NUDIX hydrolase [Hyphomicrobium methylovorum]|uniref:NUDIX hydrolase n=1 Tax=Hyphomicrobium methylovorum TaxID=84 RepID=UPI0015E66B8A|nr:NUDIX hydrolase [Hyphomicrobium methylovorum]MBA2127149.1 NUDIX hydrolase [Hyphomicrobium methylovorum]
MDATGAIDTEDPTPIRDAACVILIDGQDLDAKLLLGRRHADQVFLPNKWVFPGGRVDDADHELAKSHPGPYAPADLFPSIRPFAFAAVRELYEEAGLIIGTELTPQTEKTSWPAFAQTGLAPDPSALTPLARAITPPGRVRRYDTWFFTAQRQSLADLNSAPDGELLDLAWFTLAEARALDLPNITRMVLEDITNSLAHEADSLSELIPFYYSTTCGFQRTLISCREAIPPP